MRYRLTFVAGLAAGYVLGTRAGRERYEQLRAAARRVAGNPAVRNTAESAAVNGRGVAFKAFDKVSERMGDRMPSAVSERVHALRDHDGHRGDGWGSGTS
ncbi:YtxH domain-containing protein [Streptomyces sp. NPDC059740]|uniref:YtxH domain-containing protein n=1 Tax=Streptomyces sp. NPDC059740 TaxID=3346926 RepID=UPI003656501C